MDWITYMETEGERIMEQMRRDLRSIENPTYEQLTAAYHKAFRSILAAKAEAHAGIEAR